MDAAEILLTHLDDAIPAIRAGIINESTMRLCNVFDALKNSLTATAGVAGEYPLVNRQSGNFLIKRMPDDPVGSRISIGELSEKLVKDPDRAYLVYRGDKTTIANLLRRALEALEKS